MWSVVQGTFNRKYYHIMKCTVDLQGTWPSPAVYTDCICTVTTTEKPIEICKLGRVHWQVVFKIWARFHLILELRSLFLIQLPFLPLCISDVMPVNSEQTWLVVTVDLKYVFLHFHPCVLWIYRKFSAFTLVEWCTLSFGLSMAPSV